MVQICSNEESLLFLRLGLCFSVLHGRNDLRDNDARNNHNDANVLMGCFDICVGV